MGTQYYKIKKDKQEYKGERYFRLDFDRPKVCQVCVNAGEVKRGRGASIGITMIDSISFMANYMVYYLEPTSKKTFDQKFDMIVRILKAR
jgi:hypothetical protein